MQSAFTARIAIARSLERGHRSSSPSLHPGMVIATRPGGLEGVSSSSSRICEKKPDGDRPFVEGGKSRVRESRRQKPSARISTISRIGRERYKQAHQLRIDTTHADGKHKLTRLPSQKRERYTILMNHQPKGTIAKDKGIVWCSQHRSLMPTTRLRRLGDVEERRNVELAVDHVGLEDQLATRGSVVRLVALAHLWSYIQYKGGTKKASEELCPPPAANQHDTAVGSARIGVTG